LEKLAHATQHDTRVKLRQSSLSSSQAEEAESSLAGHSNGFLQAFAIFNETLHPAKRDAQQAFEDYVTLAVKLRLGQDGDVAGSTHGQDVVKRLAKHHHDLKALFDEVQKVTQKLAGLRRRHKRTLTETEARCLSGSLCGARVP
jgi:hypothetical protein